MTQARVRALRSIEVGVTDIDAALRFYTDVWHLTWVAESGGAHYLRGTGAFHHILSLRQTAKPELIRMVLDAADRATVDALHQQAKAHGLTCDAPATLAQPHGDYGFGCKDVEGRNIWVVCGVKDHADGTDRPDRPRKLSHVNLNTQDNDASFACWRDAFGFTLSDHTSKFRFIRCNADHHSIVLAFGGGPTLNHIAFEMPDLDSVMRGAGRMIDHNHPIEWGPGRHGPGQNVFCYFVGPGDIPIEYTAEMQQVDESYPAGTPQDWTWPPRRLDRWGICYAPSQRVHEAGLLYRFSDDGYRLPR